MRVFWLACVLSLAVLFLNFMYLPTREIFFVIFGLFFLNTNIFLNILRLYKIKSGLQLEKVELASVIANLDDGVIAYTNDFKILIFNNAAQKLFGLSDDMVGQIMSPAHAQNEKFRSLVQVFFPALAPLAIIRSEPNQYPQIMDISLDQSNLELRVTTSKIFGVNNEALGFVKIVHDRTRELMLLKTKTEFISVAAHQLRTPLTSIHWASDALRKNENLSGDDKNMVLMIGKSTEKLLNIVDDLLNTAKIEEGRFGYIFDDLDLVEFVGEILTSARDKLKQYGIKLYFDKPEDSNLVIKADGKKLEMALSNLLDNAARYNVKNGEVAVSLKKFKDKPYVQVSIRDSGIGISSEDLKKLFTKFYRGDAAIKLQTEGSGLGLFIVKNIIERHGGTIWVESELNRGTTFHFTLPTDSKLIPLKERVYFE